MRYIVKEDPVTGGPITFLGSAIPDGVNLAILPFLKIAEDEIKRSKIMYKPSDSKLSGFEYRNMKFGGKPHPTIPSFHKFGLAIDIDPSANEPADGRGDIPDGVVMTMVKAGFAWGEVGNKDFAYLGHDAMHFQFRFHLDDDAAKAIIDNSTVGKQYWAVVQPMLAQIGTNS